MSPRRSGARTAKNMFRINVPNNGEGRWFANISLFSKFESPPRNPPPDTRTKLRTTSSSLFFKENKRKTKNTKNWCIANYKYDIKIPTLPSSSSPYPLLVNKWWCDVFHCCAQNEWMYTNNYATDVKFSFFIFFVIPA